ncbi:MAG: NAD(P)H-quinone oxidoreductase [Alphaproteobacteria bacterium]
MKAIQFDQPGPPDVLKVVECKTPKLNSNQVLINVKFAGVNRPDLIQREGNYPAPKDHSQILGLEVSGLVVEIGKNVKKFKKGDEVAALVNGGGYAEFCAVDEETVFKIPKHLSMLHAASIPECYFTVWSNIVMRGKITENESVLIHGGTSGIGIAAIQILRLFKSEIFTTVGNDEKKKFCQNLGVKNTYNYIEQNFFDEIKKVKPSGINLILDFIGGEYVSKNINLLCQDGRLVNIGFQKGSIVNLNLMKVMLKRLIITGSTLRIRSSIFKGQILRELKKHVFPSFENERIKCYIDSVYNLEDAAEAHKRMESSNHIGKIIIKV